MEIQEVLTKLCALSGPSGFEQPVARCAAGLLEPWVDEVRFTRLGSVLGVRRCGKPDAARLLLDAHLDEIGLIVTGAEEGFLRFRTLGGVDPRMLWDREVMLLTQPERLGVVACLPPHIQTSEDTEKSVPVAKLYIDAGLTREEAERLVPVGTPGVFRGGCVPLGEKLISGKALDDRSCIAAILRALELLEGRELSADLYVLFSTQEETGSAGAITGAWVAAPDACVAVDVTHGATPDAPKEKTFPLEKGPVIGLGPNCTRTMSDKLEELAKKLEIPYQIEVMSGHSGTNAWPIQVSREGVATAVLSLPLRYMHTPVEVCSRSDLEQTARLLAAFAEDFGAEKGDWRC